MATKIKRCLYVGLGGTGMNALLHTKKMFIETYGEVPTPLFVAALQLVEVSYTQRAPISQQNMYQVPYTFDAMVKPYMRLTNNSENNTEYGCKNL